MKFYLLIITVTISSLVIGQDTTGLKKATVLLNEALLKKDSSVLMQLLDNNISYGHSNGWIQAKNDVVQDFSSGKISYSKMEVSDEKLQIQKQAVAIRNITNVEGIVSGNVFKMSLQVLQVWKKTKGKWVLIARQSVKLI
jgi:hypothetical protein